MSFVTHLEALNFVFLYEFVHFENAEAMKNKIQSLKNKKIAFLELLGSQELISRKIRVVEKSLYFHTV